MFRSKKRIAELQARVEQLVDERNNARREAEQHLGATVRAAKAFNCADDEVAVLRDQLDRMGNATRRQCADLQTAKRKARQLQERLDDALGLNNPAVEAGAKWQTRRVDKAIGGAK